MNTPIYLSEEDTAKFLMFMERYDFIHTLHESGLFDIRNGYCKINVDGNGGITSVEVTQIRRP